MKLSALWSMGRGKPLAWLAWSAIGLLAGSCCALAILQYRWITEFSSAERQRLHEQLQTGLNLLSRQFNEEIGAASGSLIPSNSQIAERGVEGAYAARYENWRQSGARTGLFRRVALAIPEGDGIRLRMLDLDTARFQASDWPAEWIGIEQRMMSRLSPSTESPRGEPFDPRNSALIEIPRFASEDGDRGPRREQEWLIEDLNVDYIRDAILPHLMNRFLGSSGGLDYDTEVVLASDASVTIFGSTLDSPPDGSVTLLDIRGHGPRPGKRPPPERASPGLRPPPDSRGGGPAPRPMNFNDGRWRLLVRHHAGSLEALVERARLRNLSASGGLLLLILAIVGSLLRVSRQSQRLAESHMNFVAGVSHELRTPLTVIRTAAYNLRGKMANRPEQVEKYGKLIQEESEKLGALVEQVLQFASGQAGHVIREREPVAVESLIEDSLRGNIESMETRGIQLEKRIDTGLPPVLADRLAMKHALQNLVDNALEIRNRTSERRQGLAVWASAIRTGTPAAGDRDSGRRSRPGHSGQRSRSRSSIRSSAGGAPSRSRCTAPGLGLSLARRIVEAHERHAFGSPFSDVQTAKPEPSSYRAHSGRTCRSRSHEPRAFYWLRTNPGLVVTVSDLLSAEGYDVARLRATAKKGLARALAEGSSTCRDSGRDAAEEERDSKCAASCGKREWIRRC
jgi:hypothetical protein